MINLLIADDEPLVQAGIKSMLNWEQYHVNIIGTAMNGSVAYDMILEHCPEIVITDVKMPAMTGLELARKCYEENRKLPVFIILTSYEEFQFVREAISYQVMDYLIKLELTPELLASALERAIAKVQELRKQENTTASSFSSVQMLQEQFYTRLILNLFESRRQFELQSRNLNLDFSCDLYTVSYAEIQSSKLHTMSAEQQLNLYTSSLQMMRELTGKYIPCHVVSLDTKRFAILFFLHHDGSEQNTVLPPACRSNISNAMEQVAAMLYNYYSVILYAGIGIPVADPLQIASSFQDAKQIFPQADAEHHLIFAEDADHDKPLKNVFNMSLFKEDIRKAYAEFDEKALFAIFTSIIELFEDQPAHYVQALDAAGNILYLSLSLLNNGEQIVSEIFQNKANGYRSLYELTNVSQILSWLALFRDGLCKCFATHNKDYKNHIVVNVKKYINEHIEEKITLNKAAEVFNISSNYLSVLFSKYNDIGFNDYINQCKIDAAIKMMKESDLKIYEVSDTLGFESAFYFSRVFKKVTGLSPRDYMNQTE